MIAVFGGTGNTGRAVVKELQKLGEPPLCIVRDLDKAHGLFGSSVKTAAIDVMDRKTLAAALKGVNAVFVVTGHNPDMAKQQNSILDAALDAGVKHLVRVSGGRAVVGPNVASVVGRGHHEVEETLKKSGIGWTILRPGLFMQNTFAQAALIKSDNKMVLPFAKDLPLALTDVRDTGAVGARILLEPAKHAGKTYEYTGTMTDYGAFAEVFSKVLGRTIAYVGISPEQAEQALKARGLPDWLVTHQIFIARVAAEGAFSHENTQPTREIGGRAPITTTQFVEDHKAMFA